MSLGPRTLSLYRITKPRPVGKFQKHYWICMYIHTHVHSHNNSRIMGLVPRPKRLLEMAIIGGI